MKKEQELFTLLNTLEIAHKTYHHEPVYTVEEAQKVCDTIPGHHVKNLFLKDNKKKLWLIVVQDSRKIALKKLTKLLDIKRVSFASEELLQETLGVQPGSVTPFALINDTEKKVTVVIDKSILDGTVNFHPLRNDMTTAISAHDFETFLNHCKNPIIIADLSKTEPDNA